MNRYFQARVTRLGDEVADFVDGGVMIFFAEPVPDELAAVSVIHETLAQLTEPTILSGDTLVIGDSSATINAVGGQAAENLRTLGHLVVYIDPDPDAALLPGAVHVQGRIAIPRPGDAIALVRSNSSRPETQRGAATTNA